MAKYDVDTDAFGRLLHPKGRVLPEIKPWKRTRSSFYEEFFSGYELQRVPGKHGRGQKKIRRYTGALYSQSLLPGRGRIQRLIYVAIFMLSSLLFLGALILDVASNRCWYVMTVAFFAVVALARVLLSLHTYVWSSRELKRYEYLHGACPLPVRCRYASFLLLAAAVEPVIIYIAQMQLPDTLELVRAAMIVGAAVAVRVPGEMEKKVQYKKIESDTGKARSQLIR